MQQDSNRSNKWYIDCKSESSHVSTNNGSHFKSIGISLKKIAKTSLRLADVHGSN